MTARREIWEVARREFIQRWRARATRISFVLMILITVGAAVAAALTEDRTPTDDYGLVGARAAAVAPILHGVATAEGRKARIATLMSRAAAEDAVRSGRVDVALVGERIIVKKSRDTGAVRVAQSAVAAAAGLSQLRRAGLDQRQARQVLAPRPAPVEVLEPGAIEVERDRGVLVIGAMILLGTLLLYGQAVAQSVTEEKSSRVIEILLTSLAPRRLLAGKILGVGVLGLGQLIVICAAGLVAGRLAGQAGLPAHATGAIALVVAWFVLGFAFFSVAYAALGALVSRQEDLEASMAPANVAVIGGYVAAMAAIQNPDGPWAHIAAFIPPFAPMVVPARVVIGDMGPLGLLAAVAVEVTATVLLIRIAARVYERGLLQVGAPVSLTSALHWGHAVHLHVPDRLLQVAAVGTLLAGVLVGAGRAPGLALIATGLVLTVLIQRRHHHPPPAAG